MNSVPLRAAFSWMAAALLAALVRLFRWTWQVRVCGEVPGARTLIAFWHGDQVALAAAPQGARVAVLISLSRDGEIGAGVARRLGFGVVRGSTSRGAVAAGLALYRRLRARDCVAIAADGPRGPRHRAKSGIVRLARRSGGAVVPVAAVAWRGLRLRSWDRMLIPAPFTTVEIVYGQAVAADEDLQFGLDLVRRRALCSGSHA